MHQSQRNLWTLSINGFRVPLPVINTGSAKFVLLFLAFAAVIGVKSLGFHARGLNIRLMSVETTVNGRLVRFQIHNDTSFPFTITAIEKSCSCAVVGALPLTIDSSATEEILIELEFPDSGTTHDSLDFVFFTDPPIPVDMMVKHVELSR